MRSGGQRLPPGRPWGGAEQNLRTPYRTSGTTDEAMHARRKREQEILESAREERRALEEHRLRTEARAEGIRADEIRAEEFRAEAAARDERARSRQNPTRRPPVVPIELPADVALVETSDVGFECVGMHADDPKIDGSPFEDCVQCHLIRDKKAGGAEKVAEREAGREAGREAERAAERAADNAAERPERTTALEDLHGSRGQALQKEKEGEGWQLAKNQKRKPREKPTEKPGGARASRVLDRIDKTTEKSEKSDGSFAAYIKDRLWSVGPEQERDHWKAKYEEMKRGYGELDRYYHQKDAQAEDLKAKLKKEKDDLRLLREEYEVISGVKEEFKNRYHQNRKLYEDAERRAINLQKDIVAATEVHLKERDQLKIQIDDLYTSHIRSVNTVGTGLDPISDDAISKKFTDLSDEIYSWCRRAFRGKFDVLRLDEFEPVAREMELDKLLGSRIFDTYTIPYSRLIETITWGYIEQSIFSVWFPGMASAYLEPVCALQDWISAGDKSAQKERREYWRAYTCSLLFQNRDVAASLLVVDTYQAFLAKYYELVQREKKGLPEPQSEALRERLRKAMHLAAELRCQRGAYEIDDNIQLGEPYDETRMDDAGFTAETCETPVVLCILSKGCVRRPFAGSDGVDSRVCKARVLVEEARR